MAKGNVVIYYNDDSTLCDIVIDGKEVTRRDGITDRNIDQLVKKICGLGYHVTLFKVTERPKFFARKRNGNDHQLHGTKPWIDSYYFDCFSLVL